MIGAWLAEISGSSLSTICRSFAGDRFFKAAAVCVTTLLLGLFVAVPIWAILREGLILPDGSWGLGNFVDYFRDPRFVTITSRSLLLAFSAVERLGGRIVPVQWRPQDERPPETATTSSTFVVPR